MRSEALAAAAASRGGEGEGEGEGEGDRAVEGGREATPAEAGEEEGEAADGAMVAAVAAATVGAVVGAAVVEERAEDEDDGDAKGARGGRDAEGLRLGGTSTVDVDDDDDNDDDDNVEVEDDEGVITCDTCLTFLSASLSSCSTFDTSSFCRAAVHSANEAGGADGGADAPAGDAADGGVGGGATIRSACVATAALRLAIREESCIDDLRMMCTARSRGCCDGVHCKEEGGTDDDDDDDDDESGDDVEEEEDVEEVDERGLKSEASAMSDSTSSRAGTYSKAAISDTIAEPVPEFPVWLSAWRINKVLSTAARSIMSGKAEVQSKISARMGCTMNNGLATAATGDDDEDDDGDAEEDKDEDKEEDEDEDEKEVEGGGGAI